MNCVRLFLLVWWQMTTRPQVYIEIFSSSTSLYCLSLPQCCHTKGKFTLVTESSVITGFISDIYSVYPAVTWLRALSEDLVWSGLCSVFCSNLSLELLVCCPASHWSASVAVIWLAETQNTDCWLAEHLYSLPLTGLLWGSSGYLMI